ncbi:hypothetical protein GCK32_011772 [Trichostrongylus colubriformis]|uniref:Uncharacterized protein n=1 Tax=Trichostrongylus colubriformis TaxID=6319 RepID=A0AAN8FUM7_TRICO
MVSAEPLHQAGKSSSQHREEGGSTGLPEAKREQIRSNATSQSRPLPLPLSTADSSTPFISHSPSKEYTKDTVAERESTFGSPTRIAQVFPLIPKEHVVPYIQRSVQDVSQKKSHLSVNDRPIRAHSVELLQPGNNEEIRRTSFDVPRGTGRQLPSTEGLENFVDGVSRKVHRCGFELQCFHRHPIAHFGQGCTSQISNQSKALCKCGIPTIR